MLLLLTVAPTIEAQSRSITPEVRELFAQGRSLYQARRFPEAALAFGRVTTLEPDAADAWANLGTAAWMAGDTATAVVGWQRALRLEPLARDVRVRLRQVSSSRLDSPAWVPPIPPRALAVVALALWMGACAIACVHAMRRRRVMSPSVLLPSLAAALLLGGGELLDERLAARSLVVVGEAAHLRALPALSGTAIATVHPGDVARTIARRGEWALVRDEHGREGWIEGPLLISLARD
jgi:hypothetical protein